MEIPFFRKLLMMILRHFQLFNLVSCQCKLKCNKRCGCFINGLVYTDFCNCSDFCENTDPQLSLADPDEYDLDDFNL